MGVLAKHVNELVWARQHRLVLFLAGVQPLADSQLMIRSRRGIGENTNASPRRRSHHVRPSRDARGSRADNLPGRRCCRSAPAIDGTARPNVIGRPYFPIAPLHQIDFLYLRDKPTTLCAMQTLGPNHRAVLDLMLLGYRRKEIARKLSISVSTVDQRIDAARGWYGVNCRSDAIIRYAHEISDQTQSKTATTRVANRIAAWRTPRPGDPPALYSYQRRLLC